MSIQKKLTNLPDSPGIYFFYNTRKELIYVGKATSLRNRVRSYFRGKRTPRPIEQMIHEVVTIKHKVAGSVLEAIIMEANVIKKQKPKYNVLGRDDKSWNYIVITKGEYPLVKTMRQHEYAQLTAAELKRLYLNVFGPCPGLNAKATMKLLRRMFRFSTCQKKRNKTGRPCLYREIGLCLGVCTNEISSTQYKRQVIQPLVTFLNGGKKRLIKTFEQRMKKASKEQKFEEAARLRDQLGSLQKIRDVALLNKSFVESEFSSNGSGLRINRIEGYDISNLGSTGKVGSMVVFNQDGPLKSYYRKFKIKSVDGQSDVDCMEEVIRRRLKHDEWVYPDLFLIDGGKPQINRVKKIFDELGVSVPIVGIAKGPARQKNELHFAQKNREVIRWVNRHQMLLIQVRDEAHRFAIAYQRKLRSKRT